MSSVHPASSLSISASCSRHGEPSVQAVPTYVMVPSRAAVDASEVETADRALEISIHWADTLLRVVHLSPVRSFTLSDGSLTDADFVVSEGALGSSTFQLISLEAGAAYIHFPPGATGEVVAAGQRLELESALACGLVRQRADGGASLNLQECTHCTVGVGSTRFTITSVNAGKRVAGGAAADRRALGFHSLSLGLHAAFVAAAFVLMPSLGSDDATAMTDDQIYKLMNALDTSAEQDRPKDDVDEANQSGKVDTERGERSKGEEGKMGDVNAKAVNKSFSIAGNDKDRMIGRERALADAQQFGMIGLIATLDGSDPNTPIAPWGSVAQGNDAQNHLGNFWGEEPGNAFGYGGLGLSGTGETGGGNGEGIGLSSIGGLGFCGLNCGGRLANGFSSARLSLRHKPTGVGMRPSGETKVGGRIPPEVIQRVVRQNFGRMRACYEPALRSNPNLQGRVAVKFVIGRDGSVGSASNGGSDLPDSGVVSCVVRAFYGISFPQPEDGIVTVTYPIMFTPTG